MKKFENPSIELEELEIMDIITSSNPEESCWTDGMDCTEHI